MHTHCLHKQCIGNSLKMQSDSLFCDLDYHLLYFGQTLETISSFGGKPDAAQCDVRQQSTTGVFVDNNAKQIGSG